MREKIVAEARSWIGTPYHNCADIKGVGVDCGMLLVRVYCDLGLVPRFDPRPYTAQWHLHRDDERYLDGLTRRRSMRRSWATPCCFALGARGRTVELSRALIRSLSFTPVNRLESC
jgi:hypothetical protein